MYGIVKKNKFVLEVLKRMNFARNNFYNTYIVLLYYEQYLQKYFINKFKLSSNQVYGIKIIHSGCEFTHL